MNFRMPIKDAKGLGSAHHGTAHWWLQRLTALALLPLIFWLVVVIAAGMGGGFETARARVGHPINALLMVLLLGALFYHATLGLQVVLEDYVDHFGRRLASIVVVKFAAILLGTSGILAVLMIALGE